MKKLASLILALAICASACGISAFAYTKAKSVRIHPGTSTIQRGDKIKLKENVSPKQVNYYDVQWNSSDSSIVNVDNSGNIEGLDIGKATISCEIYGDDDNGQKIMLGSASITITVVSKHGASRINIYAGSDTVRVGRTLQLTKTVYPSNVNYYEVQWITYDTEVVSLDEYGEVTGLAPGEAVIICQIYGDDDQGKKVWLGSGETTITVVESSTGGGSQAQASSSGRISASEVNEAVKKALKRGAVTRATFKDADSISASALQAAALTMKNGGGTVLLNFDTMNGKSVEGRLTLNPAESAGVRGNIRTGIHTDGEDVSKAEKKFKKYFANDVIVIKADHSGSYAMNVTYAVKIGSPLAKSSGLRLYGYNPDSNKYREITGANIRTDDNGYVHFTTPMGDYLIISDGELSKK